MNQQTDLNVFYDFSLRATSAVLGENCWYAHFKLKDDMTHLLPYIQATVPEAIHFENPEYMQFKLDGVFCGLYPPDQVAARFFRDREHAMAFARRLIDFLTDLETRKSQITPRYRSFRRLQVPDILRLLPLTNCGQCGFATCMAFAGAVSRRKAALAACPDLPAPIGARAVYPVFDDRRNVVSRIEVDVDPAAFLTRPPAPAAPAKAGPSRRKRKPGLTGEREGIIFKLSGREIEVIRLIAEGFANREIARILEISPHTVKSHVVHIFNKLGVSDRTQAAVWAAQNELI